LERAQPSQPGPYHCQPRPAAASGYLRRGLQRRQRADVGHGIDQPRLFRAGGFAGQVCVHKWQTHRRPAMVLVPTLAWKYQVICHCEEE